MTAHRRHILIGSTILVALLAALIVPNFRRGAASLAHPDPVGPTAYSKSAIGHAAFLRLLQQLDIPASISESGSGGHVGPDDVLVVAEPRTDQSTLAEVSAMLTSPTMLLVLPKRTGKPDPDKPYWLAADKLVAEDSVTRVLRLVDPEATVVRNAAPPPGVTINKVQLVHSAKLRPLLAASGGILIGERRIGNRRIVVLSDPDLIANHALSRGDNSVVAVDLVRNLRAQHLDGEVIFDEFIHGFSPKPFHLLGILFQFPFNLVTLQMALAAALLAWAATARFGAPVALPLPIEAGKRSLIDTGARLLAQTGRIPDLSARYCEELIRDTTRLVRGAAPPAGAPASSPQAVWTWRKELLGESRPHTKLD
jgi:hypothetical protein